MGNPHETRLNEDLVKIRTLAARIPSVLKIDSVSGNPPQMVQLTINIPTARDEYYPQTCQDSSRVEIQFPVSYPLPPGPTVVFKTPIFNPNVYPSGMYCYGSWKPTENMELFVIRLLKVIALDPDIVYPGSAANRPAAEWYLSMRRSRPHLFPTLTVTQLLQAPKPKIIWLDR